MSKQPRTALARFLDRFLHMEASSGIVLLLAAVVAIGWANSPARDAYAALWARRLGPVSVQFAINECVMVLFFLLVGLEVRRETREGELSEAKRAALPVVAALGGMIAPALLYRLLNRALPERSGWGVPTATDIAFAVGVLALLGKRVPSALRVMLLALAIIDDIGAIVLIALFYSAGIAWSGMVVAGLAIAILMLSREHAWLVIPASVVLWFGLHHAHVHPTLAGVIVGLLVPAAPAARLERALHPWVAFGVMPLFALANAGVALHVVHGGARTIALGVIVGLVLGKPLGILAATFLATKLGVVALPERVSWRGVAVVGVVAGIGFTMSIFIAGLAFTDAEHLRAAKSGVLVASVSAGIFALLLGRLVLPRPTAPDITATDAEQSTEA